MKIYLIMLLLFVIPSVSSSIVINEIMYNPLGEDNNKEYVELYMSDIINLNNYIIQDKSSQDILELLQFVNSSYALIIEEGFNYTGINASIYSVNLTIGNNLNNDEDIIIIKDSNETIFDVIHYYSNFGADGNGMSLCKLNNIWNECTPTSGYENPNYIDYSSIKITEFLPDPLKEEKEWIELYNNGNIDLDIEGLKFKDEANHNLIISDIYTGNNTLILSHNYLVIYMDEGKLLNNEGFEKIRLYKDGYLIDEVSYDGSIESLSWSKVNNKWIRTIPTPRQENYIEEPDYSSSLKINKIYIGNDDKAKFGDSLRVRIMVYKGDTTKYNLDLYAVDENNKQISKRSEINLEDTFTNYTLIVPLQIEPNCNKKYPDGAYKIILKGLDEIDTEEIEIGGITESLCEEIKVQEKSSSEKSSASQNKQSFEVKNETSLTPITSSVLYESTDIKARNMGIYFFSAVLLILIIYLIFGKAYKNKL